MTNKLMSTIFATLLAMVFASPTRGAVIITSYSNWKLQATVNLSTITFEDRSVGSILDGFEYVQSGLTIRQRDGHAIRVTAGGDGSYAQSGNFQSSTRGISSNAVPGYPYGYDDSKSDNYDFEFVNSPYSAGLWVGNLNPGNNSVTVQFLDSNSAIIDSLVLSTSNSNLVGLLPYNNRLFVGLHSPTPIDRIRVLGGRFDDDGNTFDDITFSSPDSAVPEPSALLIALTEGIGLLLLRRRNKLKLSDSISNF